MAYVPDSDLLTAVTMADLVQPFPKGSLPASDEVKIQIEQDNPEVNAQTEMSEKEGCIQTVKEVESIDLKKTKVEEQKDGLQISGSKGDENNNSSIDCRKVAADGATRVFTVNPVSVREFHVKEQATPAERQRRRRNRAAVAELLSKQDSSVETVNAGVVRVEPRETMVRVQQLFAHIHPQTRVAFKKFFVVPVSEAQFQAEKKVAIKTAQTTTPEEVTMGQLPERQAPPKQGGEEKECNHAAINKKFPAPSEVVLPGGQSHLSQAERQQEADEEEYEMSLTGGKLPLGALDTSSASSEDEDDEGGPLCSLYYRIRRIKKDSAYFFLFCFVAFAIFILLAVFKDEVRKFENSSRSF